MGAFDQDRWIVRRPDHTRTAPIFGSRRWSAGDRMHRRRSTGDGRSDRPWRRPERVAQGTRHADAALWQDDCCPRPIHSRGRASGRRRFISSGLADRSRDVRHSAAQTSRAQLEPSVNADAILTRSRAAEVGQVPLDTRAIDRGIVRASSRDTLPLDGSDIRAPCFSSIASSKPCGAVGFSISPKRGLPSAARSCSRAPFEPYGGLAVAGWSAAARVAPAVDGPGAGHSGLRPGAELALVERAAFERGEEALAGSVLQSPSRHPPCGSPLSALGRASYGGSPKRGH